MTKNLSLRAWFYFRTGWGTYFALLFSALNTLVVTYYLAIEKYDFLLVIFPTFLHYVMIAVLIGIPVLITAGYIHFKKSGAFRAEADIAIESNPYFRRSIFNTEALMEISLKLSEVLLKISNNQKLSDTEIEEIKKIEQIVKDQIATREIDFSTSAFNNKKT